MPTVTVTPDPWECAYGENAWQAPARLVHATTEDPLALGRFTRLEGTEPSYNNLVELDRQLQTITHIAAAFDLAGSVPVMAIGTKHGNACGAGVADAPADAVRQLFAGDPRAIFGGWVLLSADFDEALAAILIDADGPVRRLLDLIAAPSFTDGALELLARKHGKCRILANPALGELGHGSLDTALRRREVRGGVLEQPNFTFVLDLADAAVQRHGTLTADQERDLLLAWAVGATSNSNTTTLVRDGQLLGNGVGQQDRVGGCALAVTRARDAGHDLAGAVAYSDSFFPFPDGPQVLVDAGVTAIFSTTGSVRDDLVRDTLRDASVTLVQLSDRDARGFFGH